MTQTPLHRAERAPRRRLHPGLSGLLFLPLTLLLTAAALAARAGFLLAAGLPAEAALGRLDVLTIYVAMPLAALAALYLAGLLTAVYVPQLGAGPGPAFWRYALTQFFVALGEELLHRGYLLRRWTEWLGRWPAAASTGLLFGAAHLLSPGAGVPAAAVIAVHGLVYAWAVHATGSLWPAVGLHWAWNVVEAGVLGLPNSGTPVPFSLVATAVDGPAWWTGGPFGPEAGVIGLVAILPAVLVLRPAARRAYRS